jgi:hypothetical protein
VRLTTLKRIGRRDPPADAQRRVSASIVDDGELVIPCQRGDAAAAIVERLDPVGFQKLATMEISGRPLE